MFCTAEPEVLNTRDGKRYEGVASVTVEDDGRIKISHSGGISRIPPGNLMPASQKQLGLDITDPEEAEIIKLGTIKTIEGREYLRVSGVRITPSFISFVHSTGATSVRYENLPEDIKTKCNYDPVLAQEYDRQREATLKAMREAEHRIAVAEQKAARNAALRQSRAEALGMLRFTTIGSTRYWTQDPRMRDLTDATAASILTKGGFSAAEANYYLNQLRFR
jgi:hypothetical protein